MEVSSSEYALVESILFDNRSNFNEKQKEFIEFEETKTILAGPGAGKTTALAAKIVLLLKQLNSINSKSGICIITHTNVAVNEINAALVKAGIGEISHPHFIGTIHEFFNKYCAIPYFKSKYAHANIFFDDPNPNDIFYYKSIIGNELPWSNNKKYEKFKNDLAERISNNDLYIDKENRWGITNKTNWQNFNKYKNLMIKAKLSRKIKGFLNYDDTFLFAKLFLNEEKFKGIIRRRFKYIFLDEFQDTHPDGTKLLAELFLTEDNIYQRIGDPYQTIGFHQEMPVISENEIFRINLTNRFGKEIAEHLNIIIPESHIQVASDDIQSFKPILLIYRKEEDIYPHFKKIIKDYEERYPEYKGSNKKDKVLVLDRRWTSRVKTGVLYQDKKKKEFNSKNYELKKTVINFIIKKIVNDKEEKAPEVKEWMKKHKEILSLNKLLVKLIKSGANADNLKELREQINIFLEEKDAKKIIITNKIFKIISDICNEARTEDEIKSEDDIYTIHSVKGETLRSVLLVDLGMDEKNLVNVLVNRYKLKDEVQCSTTFQNLFYVALSRVTHLFVFALEEGIINPNQISKLEEKWNVIYTKSAVTV